MTDSKWTEGSVPSQTGRTAVVTGGNTGLGFEVARVLAAKGASVVLAVRNPDKGKEAVAKIRTMTTGADITLQHLDVASLASVREAAEELRARHDTIDLLVNNAGLMYPPRSTTVDGFELRFGTNYLGHFALTGLLLDRLLPVVGSRVMTISSVGHRIRAAIHFDDLQWEKSYDRVAAYGQANLAKLMFTYELQRRLAAANSSTIAVAAHPGFANTDIGQYMPAPMRIGNAMFGRIISQPPPMGALSLLRPPPTRPRSAASTTGRAESAGSSAIRWWANRATCPMTSTSSSGSGPVAEELTGVTYPELVRPAPTAVPTRVGLKAADA